MQHPALAWPGRRSAGQDKVAPIRLVGPIVDAGPLGQRPSQLPGRAGVYRMYKRINDFPVSQGGGPPCEQERAQVHAYA